MSKPDFRRHPDAVRTIAPATATGPGLLGKAGPVESLALTLRATGVAERIALVLALALGVTYLVTGIAYLCLDYWPVTEQDFWQIYDVCFYYSWLESALFKIHNHSLFFPSFIWLADLRFFQGNQTLLFAVGLFLQIVSTLLLALPIVREPRIDLTFKCLAILTIVSASFWMGRGYITTSGGFNCMTSLVTLGAVAGFLLLPAMRNPPPDPGRTTLLLIAAGVLATFSFGTGLAVWPTFLFLGWNLRLPYRTLALIALGAFVALLVYRFLPPPEDSSALWDSFTSPRLTTLVSLKQLCWFIGAPIFYSLTAWQGIKPSSQLIESSGWLLWGGAIGIVLGAVAITSQFIRRDLNGKNMEYVGLGLITLNLCISLLVVVSRVERFREIPVDAAAPRYLFWSSLFWAGLLLIALHHAQRLRIWRWVCIFLAFVFPVAGWQFHRDEGLHWRYAKLLASEGATSLINGVTDPQRLLAPTQEQIDAVAPQLRARRLDMFSEGLQDWIDQPASELFRANQFDDSLQGKVRFEELPHDSNPSNAVRVVGQLTPTDRPPPATMVILDRHGVVAGIARSFFTHPLFNKLLFGNRLVAAPLRGYIRHYDPENHYTLRSVDDYRLSDREIPIAPLPAQLSN